MCSVPLRYWSVIENDNRTHIIKNDESTIVSKAVMSSDSDKWLNAIKFETNSMYANQVWTLVDAPKGVTPIGCKWVFKRKIRVDSQVETYKARLVTKGFGQK